MPIYQYQCECGRFMELNRYMSERDDPVQCECGKSMKRSWGVGGVYIR